MELSYDKLNGMLAVGQFVIEFRCAILETESVALIDIFEKLVISKIGHVYLWQLAAWIGIARICVGLEEYAMTFPNVAQRASQMQEWSMCASVSVDKYTSLILKRVGRDTSVIDGISNFTIAGRDTSAIDGILNLTIEGHK